MNQILIFKEELCILSNIGFFIFDSDHAQIYSVR
jgi:hypothetical protein